MSTIGPGAFVCPGCHNECLDDVCWCGDEKKHHGMETGHNFVPMGCTCGYHVPPKSKLPYEEAVERWDKAAARLSSSETFTKAMSEYTDPEMKAMLKAWHPPDEPPDYARHVTFIAILYFVIGFLLGSLVTALIGW